jgi:phosphotriesterase-related protein
MLAVGADPKRLVIRHTDVEPDASYMETLFSMGVFVEFDNFGKEFYINKADRGFAGGIFVTDLERVRLIARLLESGYESQVLITNDICLKSMLHAFGGWGYDHIVTNVVPMMTDQGISEAVINRLLVDNPARLFT